MKPFNPIERAAREATIRELERLGIATPASLLGFEIPKSIRKDTDRDIDTPDQYDETRDWPNDAKLDDPRRGQARHINRERG